MASTRELRKRPGSVVYAPAKRQRLSLTSQKAMSSFDDMNNNSVLRRTMSASTIPSGLHVRTTSSPTASNPKNKTPRVPVSHTQDAMHAFVKGNAPIFAPLLHDDKMISALTSTQKMIPYTELKGQPTLIQGQMKDYQLQGLSFLVWLHRNGASGILGDEMGLGKTLQTLSLFAYLHEHKMVTGTQLVICPLSVLSSWISECAKWVPTLKVARLHGTANERAGILYNDLGVGKSNTKKPDIVVATYEAYKAEHKRLKALGCFQYLVLDEGHRIKNTQSDISQSLQGMGTQHRLLLTGTPLQNNLSELYALLHWLYPSIFTPASQQAFVNAFDLTKGRYDQKFMTHCERLLQLIMLRRTKEGLRHQLDEIPPREEHILYVPLSPLQRFWYSRLLTHLDSATFTNIFGGEAPAKGRPSSASKTSAKRQKLESDDDDSDDLRIIQSTIDRTVSETKTGSSQWRLLLNLLMQLRKVCNHPYIMHDGAPDPYYLGEHLVMASSKFVLVDKLLKKILAANEQTLCFSGFTGMLDMMEDLLRLREIPYARLDGGTNRARRALDIQLFNAKPSPYKVFLLSTRAGGLGVNLASAANVIMLDCDWNPQVTLQAIARAHRIGQKSVVKVYTIVTENSVESQMLSRLRKKAYLAAKVLGNAKQNMQNVALKSIVPSAELSTSSNCSGSSTPSIDVSVASTATDGSEVPEEPTSLGFGDLVDILKTGTAALASPWENEASPSDAFRSASFEEVMERSRRKQDIDAARMDAQTATPLVAREVQTDEENLLRGAEQVKTRLWQGRMHSSDKMLSNFDIRQRWENLEKRIRKERVVTIDGHPVSVESIGKDGAFTAVPTLTADRETLAKLQNPKRRKRQFDHQNICFTCDGYYEGDLLACRGCPRSYHATKECCGNTSAEIRKLSFHGWRCAQHSCMHCYQKAGDAGGMIIRCRTCPASYCYDCLDKEKDWVPVGDSIDEFEVLGFGANTQSYYIHCPECIKYHNEHPEEAKRWKTFFKSQRKILAKLKEADEEE